MAILVLGAATTANAQGWATTSSVTDQSRAATSAMVLQRPSHLTIRDASLRSALIALARAGHPVVYSADVVDNVDQPVTCDCFNVPLGDALGQILSGTALAFDARPDGQVVIRLAARGQQVAVVRGRVTASKTGEPIRGATVYVAEAALNAITGADGRYQLTGVPADREVRLRAQMLGFRTTETTVRVEAEGTHVVNFELRTSPVTLDPLSVSVSTGTVTSTPQREVGNAVAVLDEATIEMSGAVDLADLLQGRVTGVTAVSADGNYGGGNELRIRGTSSFRQGQTPLVYVDGVPVDVGSDLSTFSNIANSLQPGPLARLDEIAMGEVDRIEIVKGPAATTIYGTEAINGVIQIFTRDGQAGRTRVEARVEQGYSTVADRNHLLDRSLRPDLLDRLFRGGHDQLFEATVSGGTESVVYRLTGAHRSGEGVVLDNDQDLTRFGGSIRATPSDNVSLRISGNLVSREFTSLDYRSLLAVGDLGFGTDLEAGGFDELIERGQRATTSVDRIYGAATLQATPHPTLTARLSLGLDRSVDVTEAIGYVNESRGIARDRSQLDSERLSLNASGTWDYPRTGRVTSSLTAGLQVWRDERSRLNLSGDLFPDPGTFTFNLASNVDIGTFFGDEYAAIATTGIFAQEQIGFYDQLFVTLGVRADGNSALGDDYGIQLYPKLSGSWTVEPVDGWESKLRAAWGRSGAAPDPFDKTRTFRQGRSTFSGIPTQQPLDFGNPDLQPELGTEIELGAEQYFFGGRASAEITWFEQITENAILRAPVPLIYGYLSGPVSNVGELRSEGVEVVARVVPVMTGDAGIAISATLSHMLENGRITDLGPLEELSVGNQGGSARHLEGYIEGASLTDLNVTLFRDSTGTVVEPFGSRVPVTFGGIVLDGWLGGLRASANFTYAAGGHVFDSYLLAQDATAGLINDQSHLQREVVQNRYVVPTDHARLDAIRISYEVPRIFGLMTASEIWVEGRNLAILYSNARLDPTVVRSLSTSSTGGAATFGAIDYSLPAPRAFRVGIRLTY